MRDATLGQELMMKPDDCQPRAMHVAQQDRWARDWFEQMLGGHLSPDAFEAEVAARWTQGTFVQHAPDTARWLLQQARQQQGPDAGYAHDAPQLGFHSQWLAGTPGLPGAIHIDAPAEQGQVEDPHSLNRPVHRHDSARIALVTQGRAHFLVERPDRQGRPQLQSLRVQAGDLIFWPAWTDHTFHAGEGFSLVSAMARYVAPDADGFILPPGTRYHGH